MVLKSKIFMSQRCFFVELNDDISIIGTYILIAEIYDSFWRGRGRLYDFTTRMFGGDRVVNYNFSFITQYYEGLDQIFHVFAQTFEIFRIAVQELVGKC